MNQCIKGTIKAIIIHTPGCDWGGPSPNLVQSLIPMEHEISPDDDISADYPILLTSLVVKLCLGQNTCWCPTGCYLVR